MIWIPVTIFAAFVQNLRFMLQKHLRQTRLTTGGATFARFVFSAPLVITLMTAYLWISGATLPVFTGRFLLLSTVGGVSQILATLCVVALFAERNFAVGVTFKKTEVMLTALVGLVVFGEAVSGLAVISILVGFVGVVLLADQTEGRTPDLGKALTSKATGLGLLSGLLFGISATTYREATLALGHEDVLIRAGVTLAVVTVIQTALMMIWLWARVPGEISAVFRHWRVTALVGLSGMLGSLGWFIAFTLVNAAYVKALGQIELVFTFLGSYFVFKERSSRREILGTGLIVVSILILILAFKP